MTKTGHALNVPFSQIFRDASHRSDGWRHIHHSTFEGEKTMNREFQQYRFAWIEAHNIAGARLESQFKDKPDDFMKLEKAIERELAEPTNCVAWRTSQVEQIGCRDGARMAALEFFWAHRQGFRCERLAASAKISPISRELDSQCKIPKPTGPDLAAVPGNPATRQ
jgi:hypothetical protein